MKMDALDIYDSEIGKWQVRIDLEVVVITVTLIIWVLKLWLFILPFLLGM